MDRRAVMCGTEYVDKYYLSKQSDNLNASIDGEIVTVNYWPGSGSRQLRINFLKKMILNANDTLSAKFTIINNEDAGSGYWHCAFWASKNNESETSYYLLNNSTSTVAFNNLLTFTSDANYGGWLIYFEPTSNHTYSTPLQFKVEVFKNGEKLKLIRR